MEKEHADLGIFFGSLVEGISGARKVVRAVSEPTKERSRGVVHDFLVFEATQLKRKMVEAKIARSYRRLRVA
jgi:hypothetical protein